MKIMFVTQALGGGVLSILEAIIDGLMEKDEKSEFILVCMPNKDTPVDIAKSFRHPLKIIRQKPVKHYGDALVNVFDLVRVITEERPDIVHFHSSWAGFIGRLAILLLRKEKNIHYYYSPHGFAFQMRNISGLKRRLYYTLEWFAARLGGDIVAVGRDEGEMAQKLTSKVHVIPNFIDTKAIRPEGGKGLSPPAASGPLIGTMGRICFQKNPRFFNDLARRFPHASFVWIGGGELEKELTAPNIKITGFLEREQALRILGRLDLYIQCSLWEGLPMAVLEAMACALPIVVSDIPGHREIVRACSRAMIAYDIDDFAAKIKFILTHPQKAADFGAANREAVCRYYGKESSLDAYRMLYRIS